MTNLLDQLKKRRLDLGLKQHDMMLRVGMSRQQYQRLESKGNPRLDTLELVAKGLSSELLLIPQDKLNAVMAMLAGEGLDSPSQMSVAEELANGSQQLLHDPWQGLLGEDE